MLQRILTLITAVLSAGLIAACGGGGGAAAPANTIAGSVVKGPASGATVEVRRASDGQVLGTTTTSVNGTYSLTVNFSGNVVIMVQGGTYTDEATGNTVTLPLLRTVLRLSGGSVTAMVTPLTELAYGQSALDPDRFNTVLSNLATQFGLGSTNLVTTLPVVTDTLGTVNAYGRVLRGLSQYVQSSVPGGSFTTFFNSFSTTTFAAMQANFITAFNTINPGQTLTFSFDGSTLTVDGSGAGGGSGSCAVTVDGSGTYSQVGFPTVPFTLPPTKICVTGVPAGTCNAGNSALNSLAASTAVSGPGYSLTYNYAYSSDCSGALYTVALN